MHVPLRNHHLSYQEERKKESKEERKGERKKERKPSVTGILKDNEKHILKP